MTEDYYIYVTSGRVSATIAFLLALTMTLSLQFLTGGVLNTVLLAKSSAHPEDALVVKVFTPVATMLVNHDAEYALLKHLTEESDFVQLYCK